MQCDSAANKLPAL